MKFNKNRQGKTDRQPQESVFTKYYRQILVSVEIAVDMTAIFISILTGYYIYLYTNPVQAEWISYTLVATVASLAGFLFFERIGLYRQQTSLMNLIEIRKIIKAVFLLYLALLMYSYFGQTGYPRIFVIYSSVITLFFVLIERMLFFKLQQALHLRGFNVRRVLIIGAGEEGRLLYQNICQSPKLGYLVVGFLDENQHQLDISREWFGQDGKRNIFFFNNFEKLKDKSLWSQVDEIFISDHLYSYDLQKLAVFCRERNIKLNFYPILRGYYASQVHVIDINGIPMISLGTVLLSRAEQISKRIFDLTLAALVLPVLSPVFLVIIFLIRRDSEGPVFFKQMRVGKDGVCFCMYKFRSMYVDTPQYLNSPRSSEDPRITKVGRFLRRTSLDELPQIFNVIRGEMSLVGPRPEMPFIVENEYNDFYRERLKVKPGITGVWQISGDRTREIHENISYDIFYIENRSLLLDVIIIIRTLIFGVIAMRTH